MVLALYGFELTTVSEGPGEPNRTVAVVRHADSVIPVKS